MGRFFPSDFGNKQKPKVPTCAHTYARATGGRCTALQMPFLVVAPQLAFMHCSALDGGSRGGGSLCMIRVAVSILCVYGYRPPLLIIVLFFFLSFIQYHYNCAVSIESALGLPCRGAERAFVFLHNVPCPCTHFMCFFSLDAVENALLLQMLH